MAKVQLNLRVDKTLKERLAHLAKKEGQSLSEYAEILLKKEVSLVNEDPMSQAIHAYKQYCKDHGYTGRQPDKALSEIKRKYVYLRNTNGPLGKYNIKDRYIYETM